MDLGLNDVQKSVIHHNELIVLDLAETIDALVLLDKEEEIAGVLLIQVLDQPIQVFQVVRIEV